MLSLAFSIALLTLCWKFNVMPMFVPAVIPALAFLRRI